MVQHLTKHSKQALTPHVRFHNWVMAIRLTIRLGTALSAYTKYDCDAQTGVSIGTETVCILCGCYP
jgi:hypothetical protein